MSSDIPNIDQVNTEGRLIILYEPFKFNMFQVPSYPGLSTLAYLHVLQRTTEGHLSVYLLRTRRGIQRIIQCLWRIDSTEPLLGIFFHCSSETRCYKLIGKRQAQTNNGGKERVCLEQLANTAKSIVYFFTVVIQL
ncbi:hypothetical protein J6590_001139 [Homalodisca vitripennis]|nr:hypothetical protein J6590_001139 [Homalodisca vitripennis]